MCRAIDNSANCEIFADICFILAKIMIAAQINLELCKGCLRPECKQMSSACQEVVGNYFL
jgi:hypothetical protein